LSALLCCALLIFGKWITGFDCGIRSLRLHFEGFPQTGVLFKLISPSFAQQLPNFSKAVRKQSDRPSNTQRMRIFMRYFKHRNRIHKPEIGRAF
jgi:hypothetical protein